MLNVNMISITRVKSESTKLREVATLTGLTLYRLATLGFYHKGVAKTVRLS